MSDMSVDPQQYIINNEPYYEAVGNEVEYYEAGLKWFIGFIWEKFQFVINEIQRPGPGINIIW